MFYVGLVIGLFVGALFGILLAVLCHAAHDREEAFEEIDSGEW